ncbi:MAG: hypothetical protein JJV99_02830 [Colwellia sp.]|nr:hypothetical protein [Colwellia sp.]
MQLLKSLFCLQGFDNRTRFFAIFSAIYLIFIMLASAFTGKLILSLVICILFSIILGLTSLRRLHDAKLNKNWLFVPSLSFTLASLIIIFSKQHSSYYLLLIPALSSAVLLTYPSKNQSRTLTAYILGYIGPVDMSEYQQMSHQGESEKCRIEPSLSGEPIMSINIQQQDAHQAPNYAVESNTENNAENNTENNPHFTNSSNEQIDIGELIRLRLLSNKKTPLIIMTAVTITLVAVLASWLFAFFNTSDDRKLENIPSQPQQTSATNSNIERKHPLAMPDNFTLFLSQYQGVIINWQADEVETPQLWSQVSAQGDKSCQQISFNKGKPLRTLTVNVESKGGANAEYFAHFSPLDSQALIQALAFRGNFSLCGYNFSLKGSQAVLGKNEHYAQWVEY